MDKAATLGHEFYVQLVHFIPKAVSGVLVFIGFWVLSAVLRQVVVGSLHRARVRRVSPYLVSLLVQTTQVTVLIFGAVTALGTLGVNVGALIAGLGLSGFALGFALKDALSNTLAGVSILLYHPFTIGDRIAVAGVDGTGSVVEINLRYTVLDLPDKRILIPNNTLFTNWVSVLKEREHEPHPTSSF